MLIIFLSFVFLPFLNSVVTEYVSYKDYKVYEVKGNIQDISELIKFTNDIANIKNLPTPHHKFRQSSADIMVHPDLEYSFLQATEMYQLRKTLVIEDYSKIIERERLVKLRKNKTFSWTAYYDVDDIHKYLEDTSNKYSTLTKLVVGGESYEGRKLLGLRINTPTKTGKPIVVIESGIHAREWITPATTTYFINQLLTSTDPAITSLRDKFDWHIFPTINPDGYHYSHTTDRMWRKTRSKSSEKCYGADPNRNWDYNWGKHGATKDPCDYQVYMGSKPFSEKETRTFSQYILGLNNITAYIAVHSDAQMLLFPYGDTDVHVPNHNDLVKIGKTSLEYGRKVNGAVYRGPATAGELLWKVSGSSMDWVYNQSQGIKLAYTYELRSEGGSFEWPPERIPEQGDELTQMLVGFFVEACKMGYC